MTGFTAALLPVGVAILISIACCLAALLIITLDVDQAKLSAQGSFPSYVLMFIFTSLVTNVAVFFMACDALTDAAHRAHYDRELLRELLLKNATDSQYYGAYEFPAVPLEPYAERATEVVPGKGASVPLPSDGSYSRAV